MESPASPLPFPWTLAVILALVELLLAFSSLLLPVPWVPALLTPVPVLVGLGWESARWRRQARVVETRAEGQKLTEVAPDSKNPADEELTRQVTELSRELELTRFLFAETGAFASLSLQESETFARGEVQSVLKGFRSLEATASTIESGVAQSFQSMMNPDVPQSLGAIARQTQEITGELKQFFADLGQLEDRTQTYLKSHQEELEKVKAMAETIEEFFENIRMISLNLSIEASRAGSGTAGKAFQVLAQKLREFSTQAQQISGTQKAIVDQAGKVLSGSQIELRQGFHVLADRIPPLRGQLDPFAAIVQNSHGRLDSVLSELSRLSAAVRGLLTNEIGQLQFQDLNRQEHEHLAQLLLNLAARPGAQPTVPLPEAQAAEQRLALARRFNETITTSNERKVLQRYLEGHGFAEDVVKVKGSARAPGSVELF